MNLYICCNYAARGPILSSSFIVVHAKSLKISYFEAMSNFKSEHKRGEADILDSYMKMKS